MKKKIIYVLIFIFLFIFGIANINARECEYEYDGNKIKLDFKKNNGKFEATCYINGDICNGSQNNGGYDRIFNFVDGSSITSDNQCYKTLNMCEMNDSPVNGIQLLLPLVINPVLGLGVTGYGIYGDVTKSQKLLGIFGSSLDKFTIRDNASDYFVLDHEANWVNFFLTGQTSSCGTAQYIGPTDGVEFKSFCDKFIQLYSNVSIGYSDYALCGDITSSTNSIQKSQVSKCRAKAVHEIDLASDELKETCKSIIKNQSVNYNDGCVESCLNATETLNMLKRSISNQSKVVTDCPISNNLAIWIINIVRWIKYIIPAFVIIFGIVDFLRAIASEKDDEMKKAQGRFIKRLIAAALIFVIPFILEFILEKFGFDFNGCGIINL